MGLDDQAANRQTHSHTIGLFGKARIEYPGDVMRVDSCSSVRHQQLYSTVLVDAGLYVQDPRLALGHHRIDGVCDQVQKHLLQLDSISYLLREQFVQIEADCNSVRLQVALYQGNGFRDQAV
ncbi:hypothetical protein P3T40_004784 [Paraburkholderia sp. EB58]